MPLGVDHRSWNMIQTAINSSQVVMCLVSSSMHAWTAYSVPSNIEDNEYLKYAKTFLIHAILLVLLI